MSHLKCGMTLTCLWGYSVAISAVWVKLCCGNCGRLPEQGGSVRAVISLILIKIIGISYTTPFLRTQPSGGHCLSGLFEMSPTVPGGISLISGAHQSCGDVKIPHGKITACVLGRDGIRFCVHPLAAGSQNGFATVVTGFSTSLTNYVKQPWLVFTPQQARILMWQAVRMHIQCCVAALRRFLKPNRCNCCD